MPVGTTIVDEHTREVIGDLAKIGDVLMVAQGGHRGLGNAAFKSSTNRAPRKTTPGSEGEARRLRLQLKLLADVGLLGLPNAGKSTLIGQVSAADPKVADYPFTTLAPSLGVVRLGTDASFVMADIPGVIVGAADGAGLGSQFLRHLSRNRVLLHLIDVVPEDESDPIANCESIEAELEAYSKALKERPIWIVLSKVDQLEDGEVDALRGRFESKYPERKICAVSALGDIGLTSLTQELMQFLDEYQRRLAEEIPFAETDSRLEERITADVLKHSEAERERRAAAKQAAAGAEADAFDDNEPETIYVSE